MLKEIAIFAAGAAVGAGALYYGSQNIKDTIKEVNQALEILSNPDSDDMLCYLVKEQLLEMEKQGKIQILDRSILNKPIPATLIPSV